MWGWLCIIFGALGLIAERKAAKQEAQDVINEAVEYLLKQQEQEKPKE